jgi:hypothetical protein
MSLRGFEDEMSHRKPYPVDRLKEKMSSHHSSGRVNWETGATRSPGETVVGRETLVPDFELGRRGCRWL